MVVDSGSEDTHLHVVLPVSISQAEQVRLACFLREKPRCVHWRVATSRCGGMAGLVSGCGENFGMSTQFKALTKHRRRAYEYGEATNRPRPPIERSKVFGRLSSPLRLRAACVPHALHPTDEFDAPSVRKDMKPENTRVQPPQGVPTLYLANIELAHLDACVCVRAWFKSGEV